MTTPNSPTPQTAICPPIRAPFRTPTGKQARDAELAKKNLDSRAQPKTTFLSTAHQPQLPVPQPTPQPRIQMASAAWRRPFASDVTRRLLQWATWIPVAVCFNAFVAEATFVRGGSMYPFFNEDRDSTLRRDVALNWKLYPHLGLARGMIVTFKWVLPFIAPRLAVLACFSTCTVRGRELWLTVSSCRSPLDPEKIAVKRIVALEGDLVRPRKHQPAIRVPKGHIWVEGDAGTDKESLDSNTYGPISTRLVTGRLTHILYPWKKFGRIRWWEHPIRPGADARSWRYV